MAFKPTLSETVAKSFLVKLFVGVDFLPEYQVGRYRIDFYAPDLYLALELDGIFHKNRVENDKTRDAFLLAKGIKTVRIPSRIILRDKVGLVCDAVRLLVRNRYNELLKEFDKENFGWDEQRREKFGRLISEGSLEKIKPFDERLESGSLMEFIAGRPAGGKARKGTQMISNRSARKSKRLPWGRGDEERLFVRWKEMAGLQELGKEFKLTRAGIKRRLHRMGLHWKLSERRKALTGGVEPVYSALEMPGSGGIPAKTLTPTLKASPLFGSGKPIPDYIVMARRTFPRAYERWTPEEDTKFRMFMTHGGTESEFIREFGRNPSAIIGRARTLGLIQD